MDILADTHTDGREKWLYQERTDVSGTAKDGTLAQKKLSKSTIKARLRYI